MSTWKEAAEARSKRIHQQLGMPHGTATNRLRKLILFSRLKKHGENICVKCGLPIEDADDLSIEHIHPWEGRDASLFWDLDNIAFSHCGCNTPHGNGRPPRVIPIGFNWCYKCQAFKPIDDFHKNESLIPTLADRCKKCKSEENARRVRVPGL